MAKQLLDVVKQQLVFLLDEYRFAIKDEYSDEYGLGITYGSIDMQIRVVSYHRELSAYASPTFAPEEEACISNILDFIDRDTTTALHPDYHTNIKSLAKSYAKQAHFIACTIKDNMGKLKDFLSEKDFAKRKDELRKYVISKNPELFVQLQFKDT